MHISRRHFVFGSLAVPALAARKKIVLVRPHILLIVADYLPAWMLGAYGNKEVRTPNLDRLAQTGTRFLFHYTATPAPDPGRATILSGRTAMQLGGAGAPTAADITLDKALAPAGYACHTTATLPSGDAVADGLKFVDGQSAGTPFLLVVNCGDLHPPYDGIAPKYLDLFAAQRFTDYSVEAPAANARAGREMLADRVANLRKVAGGLAQLDDNLALLIARLRQKQFYDRTLVVFTSTCGAHLGRRGLWDAADASDPVNMFDESLVTPLFWSWPGRVPALNSLVALVSSYDLLPTLCAAAGATVPDRNLCGRSYLPLVEDKPFPKKQSWRSTVFAHYQNTDMARDARYKLILRGDGQGPNELYDLSADAGERQNQADNPQYLTVKNGLAAAVAAWKRQYSG